MDVDLALNEERMRNSAEALHNVGGSARHGACEEMERGAGDSATAPVVSQYSRLCILDQQHVDRSSERLSIMGDSAGPTRVKTGPQCMAVGSAQPDITMR